MTHVDSPGDLALTARQLVLTPLDPADYSAIEAAVLETARGRWFLAEYARRNRNADTEALLGAIGRLEQIMSGERAVQEMERVRFDLMEMAKVITRTKAEVASLRPDGSSLPDAGPETLDGIVRTAERATAEVLDCAETIQEAAWTLREQGSDADHCSTIDHKATQIYAACSFQDLTAQRTRRVVQAFTHLEGRINGMIDLWSGMGAEAAQAEAATTAQEASHEAPGEAAYPAGAADAEAFSCDEMPRAGDGGAATEAQAIAVSPVVDEAEDVSLRFEAMMAEGSLSALVDDRHIGIGAVDDDIDGDGIQDSVFVIEDEGQVDEHRPLQSGALDALNRLTLGGGPVGSPHLPLADDDIAFADEPAPASAAPLPASVADTPHPDDAHGTLFADAADVEGLMEWSPQTGAPLAEAAADLADEAAARSEDGRDEDEPQLPVAAAFVLRAVEVLPAAEGLTSAEALPAAEGLPTVESLPVEAEPADPLAAIDGWDVVERLRRFT